MSSKRDQIMITFFQECEDLLESLQEGLSIVEAGSDEEAINMVFRAVHSIKGGAGAFGLEQLVKFAHGFESVLDDIRNNVIAINNVVISILWRSNDLLTDLVAASREGADVSQKDVDGLIGELNELRPGYNGDDNASEELDFAPTGISLDIDLSAVDELKSFKIEFYPDSKFYQNGHEATFILRSLSELGVMDVKCDQSNIPDLKEFDASVSYMGWNIELATAEPEARIEEVFQFAEGLGIISICEIELRSEEVNLSTVDVDQETEFSATTADKKSPINRDASAAKPEAKRQKGSTNSSTVRVDVNRVDRMINLVGELVVAQAILSQCVEEIGLSNETNLMSSIDDLKQLSREIQDSVMTIRAQPVKPLFQRMSRIVRESAAATGKNVHLVTEGEMTEIDKTVIEKLADPLTHMLRNAVDHGLENEKDRTSAGKSEDGTVTLSAAHRSGRVVIEVCDDGAGIDRPRVRQIAIDKKLIAEDAKLAPEEIDAILFMPGFSTVDEVSELSGRGVGMDVVKSAIQSLGGRISVSSRPGLGSKFSISLPLTLAVLDGMVVEVASQRFVLPITTIVEAFSAGNETVYHIDENCSVISVRGEYIRVVDIGLALGFRSDPCLFEKSALVLVETDGGVLCAMAFDAIHDQRQVVIKSLEANYRNVPGVAAATILGDGKIALILDPNDPLFGGTSTDKPVEISLARTG